MNATPTPPVTAAATFCATLVDEWVRAGVRLAIVCPGSRSTPMALALAAAPAIDVQVVHDERSASFMALGVGLPEGEAAILLTTSGTAAAELHPAVVEAGLSGVPIIVCTADRPPELQDVGAPQTIDQVHLYGRSVRWFAAPEVPDDARAATWRPLAARAVAEATGKRPGPVHLNLAFREPLVGVPGELPPGRAGGKPWHERPRFVDPAEGEVDQAAALLDGRRGVIIAGGAEWLDPAEVHTLAGKLGWPVLVSPRSWGAWSDEPGVIAHADALVRVEEFAEAHRPEVVLQLGGLLASRLVAEWLAGVPVVAGMADHQWVDPGAQVVLATSPYLYGPLAERAWRPAAAEWLTGWTSAEAAAREAIATTLAAHPEPTEPAIARDVVRSLPEHTFLVVSSSMPVRDIEWYAEPGPNIRVLANRGANGIDGVVSTAVGVALTTGPAIITLSGSSAGHSPPPPPLPPTGSHSPTAVLIGDVAFLHDSTALVGLAARGVNLTIVVIDNDGGGIFSFLPQGTQLPAERFEQLFGTPHGVDLTKLAEAHGIPCQVIATQAEVGPAVAEAAATPGPDILIVRTDRAANVAVHAEIHAAIAAALDRP